MPDTYVPSIRWRCGEYQALFRLEEAAKDKVVPFVVIPEIEFDFEEWRPKKTTQDHVSPFPKRFKQKWGMRPAWIDAHSKIALTSMADGRLPLQFAFDELRKVGSSAVPVTSLDAEPTINNVVKAINNADCRGVGVRVRLEHVMRPTIGDEIKTLLSNIGAKCWTTDLIIDLGSPNYQPYADFADALMPTFSRILELPIYRSFVVMGSGYPEVLDLDKPGGILPRHDWAFFKELRTKMKGSLRVPNFGDYTIVHPNFTPQDMRKIKSGGKVIYATPEFWIIRKGGAFRDNPAQMHDHCAFIVGSGKFRGEKFSEGDAYIERCSKKSVGTSTLTKWKEIGINHHIMQVLDDLSKSVA